ncbi:MAG: EAL domain-containing protein [Candidatus Thiodiazotropha sp.]
MNKRHLTNAHVSELSSCTDAEGVVNSRIKQSNLIRHEQISLLYSSSYSSIPIAIVLALAMTYVQWGVVDQAVGISWFCAIVLTYIFRGILSIAYFRSNPAPESSRFWMRSFLSGTLLAGALWGLGAWMLYPPDREVHKAFQGVLIAGLAAGSVTSLSAARFAIVSFLALSVLPLIIRFLSEDSEIFQVLGVLLVLFFAVAGIGADRINRSILQNLRLRLDANAREIALQKSEERLQESEGKYRSLFELSEDPMLLIVDGNFVMANDAVPRLLGYENADELANTHPSRLSPEYQPDSQLSRIKADAMMAQALHDGYHRFEWDHCRKDGSIVPIEVTLTRIPYQGGQALFCVWRDMTENKKAEEAIRESEHKYRSLMEHSPLSIQEVSPQGNTLRVNRAWEKLWGIPFSDLNNYNILHDKELIDQGIMPAIEKVFAGETMELEAHEYDKAKTHQISGQTGKLWVRTFLYPLHGADGKLREVVLIQEDVTERKIQEEHILKQAHFDTLTDLPNRFLALDRLSQLINEANRTRERVAVLFLDLDDFKKINDTLGHDTGDKLLKEAASRLKSGVRRGDTVGRLGGDEFIVILGGLADNSDAGSVAETLLDRFRDSFKIDNRELILTSSIGISIYPDDGDTPSELLRKADSAMYHSKEQGRNTYSFFTEEMNQAVARRLLLEEQMHGALSRGEFSLCYQPQVDLVNRNILSVEALLRWHNPALGNVSPMEFIPVAEQTGLIVSIGQFVLQEALCKAAQWHAALKRTITVAVNLSPRQFRDPNLVTFINDTLHQAGISAKSLELEITEGVLMGGHAYTDEALVALSDMGISIAMDDFGTGYSSLSYLRSYPFNAIKIDREFINDIIEDSGDRELVNAAITMAHGLGLKVVAEGVETDQQLALLTSQGCDYGQGYYFSTPLSADEMTAMLKNETGAVKLFSLPTLR